MDKALEITIDAQAAWSSSIRECARSLNKTNFFITGEVVDGNTFGAIYYGRGKLEDQAVSNLTEAVSQILGAQFPPGCLASFMFSRHVKRVVGI